MQEIQSEFGFRSPNAAQAHLRALLNKGVIERRSLGQRARNLRLVTGVEYGRRAALAERVEEPREVRSEHLLPEMEHGIELTQRQDEILHYIQQVIERDGSSPSVQEIQSEFGFRSPNAAQTHLGALLSKGVIERRGRRARSLRLVTGVGYRRRGTVGQRSEQPKQAITEAASVEREYEVETGLDVFFNARHIVREELEGEIHAHSWRLRVVVRLGIEDEDNSDHLQEFRSILQDSVSEIEGTVLNQLEPFLNEEPTLDRIAAWISARVTDRLTPLGLRILNITLWDQPIRYVTIGARGNVA